MTEDKELIERLEGLLAKASPLPWTKDRHQQARTPDGRQVAVWDAGIAWASRDDETETNGLLLLEGVNALPALLSRLRTLVEENERLRANDEGTYDDGYDNGQADAKGFGEDLWREIRGWLEARDLYNQYDYDDGITADQVGELIRDHEQEICAQADAAKADRDRLSARVEELEGDRKAALDAIAEAIEVRECAEPYLSFHAGSMAHDDWMDSDASLRTVLHRFTGSYCTENERELGASEEVFRKAIEARSLLPKEGVKPQENQGVNASRDLRSTADAARVADATSLVPESDHG